MRPDPLKKSLAPDIFYIDVVLLSAVEDMATTLEKF